ncbi:MAG: DUF882 domain-containing protein [Rhizobiaceae bacterium]
MAPSKASAETRTLKLFFIHTKEKAEITYKRNGRYDADGLKKINRFLRDWRRNEPTKMDPRLLDLVWEAYRSTGSRDYIHVVSAYRSPATNGMLRSRSKGVAKKSQHMLGKAMDFYIPGVKLKTLRDAGLRLQGGGVGYYPRSGSPFVHFDVGNVRHWPRMSRSELVAVFPSGKTLHVPSDGKPLPGFDQALASYQSRQKSGKAGIELAKAAGGSGSNGRGLLASLFGGGADEEEENSGAAFAEAAEAPARAAPEAKASTTTGAIRILPPELANPADVGEPVQAKPEKSDPATIIAALPARNVPLPGFAPRPKADVGGGPLVDLATGTTAPLVDLGDTDPAVAEASTEVAMGIPVPTWRPSDQPVVADEVTETALLALAAAEKPARASAIGVPAARSTDALGELVVASLPMAGDSGYPELPENGPFPAAPGEIVGAPKAARVASIDTPKGALAAGAATAVRTTTKSARASARDIKPEPRPVVRTAQPDAARWALETDYIEKNLKATRAPSYAYNLVRTAPREVYTAGFRAESGQNEANRFTGKAVTFLSVARFN